MPVAPALMVGAAIVGAGAAVVGTVKTIEAQNRAARAQKQQFAYERQINQNRTMRERRDAIRAARLAGASLVQNSVNSGAQESSAALGGLGSIQSQLNSNLSFLDTQGRLADRASAASQAAANAKQSAQKWGAISDLGMAVFDRASAKIK
jgi:hypothetical protein